MRWKKYFLYLFSSAFCVFTGYSQTLWFGQDAAWYYSSPYQYMQSERCTKVELTGDTIIKGLTCKILSVQDGSTSDLISTEYVHCRKDSILYFNYYHDAFCLLYDFTAKEGDTVVVHKNKFRPTEGFLFADSIDNFQYVVLKSDTITVAGVDLKRQKIGPLNAGSWTMGEYVVEALGSLLYFFGRNGYVTTMESIGMLRCYSDRAISYKNPDWGKECDFVNGIISHPISPLRIYPNPASEIVNFESTDYRTINTIEIVAVDGRMVKRVEVNDMEAKIDISNLCNGLFFAKILFFDNSYEVYKLLVV